MVERRSGFMITSFRRGIDRRRSTDMSAPDAMWDIENGIVTAGGDVRGLRAFASEGVIGDVHGLVSSGDVLVAWTHDPSVPGSPHADLRVHLIAHPYDPGARIRRVISATNTGHEAAALVLWDNGDRVPYYGKSYIEDWIFLTGGAGTSPTDVANGVADLINQSLEYEASVSGTSISITTKQDALDRWRDFDVTVTAEGPGGGAHGLQWSVSVARDPRRPIGGQNPYYVFGVVRRFKSHSAYRWEKIVITGNEPFTVGTVTNNDIYLWPHTDRGYPTTEYVNWTGGRYDVVQNVDALVNKINQFTGPIANYFGAGNDWPGSGFRARRDGTNVVIEPAGGNEIYDAGNGWPVQVVAQGITMSLPNPSEMVGGIAPVEGESKIVTVDFSGAASPGSSVTVRVGDEEFVYRTYNLPSPSAGVTLRRRLWFAAGNTLAFSGLGRPAKFLGAFGSGWVETAEQDTGGVGITVLATWGRRLLAVSPNAVQVWEVPEDERQMALLGVLRSVGSVFPRCWIDAAGLDCILATRVGFRSVRSREAYDAPLAYDIGTPIDEIAAPILASADEFDPVACHEPLDGQLWMVTGRSAFLLTYSPSMRVAAWTRATLPVSLVYLASHDGRMWGLSDTGELFVYGGKSGVEIPDEGELPLSVRTHFIGGEVTRSKDGGNVFVGGVGAWDVAIYETPFAHVNPRHLGTVLPGDAARGGLPFGGFRTWYAFDLTCSSAGERRLTYIGVTFDQHDRLL